MPNTLMSWLSSKPADTNPLSKTSDETKSTPRRTSDTAAGSTEAGITLQPPFGPSHALSPNVQIRRFAEGDMHGYKRLNASLLPIPYQESFYRETLANAVIHDLARVAYWKPTTLAKDNRGEQLVAAIRCRLLSARPNGQPVDPPILYISTIGTLAPYRNLALATHLLADVTATAMQKHRVKTIMAHVWEANEEGIRWYTARGFRVLSREEGYYRRLAPRSAALIMAKDLVPSDVLR